MAARLRSADIASRLNLLQLAIWTIVALWVVPGRAHFLYDEAYFYHRAIEVARHAVFPVYGPPISATTPTAFTPGGSAYFLLAVPFVFGTDPRLGAAWLIVLSSLAVWCLDRALKAHGADAASRVFTVAVLTWSTWHVRLVDRIWNNNVEWPLAILLLALALSLVKRPAARSRLVMALFGLTAAVITQAHLPGGLAVAACAMLILAEGRDYRKIGPWLPALAACAVLYLPFAVWETTHQFQDTAWLVEARASSHANAGAILRSVLAPLSFQSLFPFVLVEPHPARWLLSGPSASHWFKVAISIASIGVAVLFFLRPSPLRRLVVVSWLMIPIYFLVIRREYHDHYLYSLAPFFVMPLGVALGGLFRAGRVRAVAAAAFLALWMGVHTGNWVPEYLAGLHRPTLVTQLRRAQAAAAGPRALQVSSGDPDVLIVWSLARDRFGRDLLFYVDGLPHPCRVETGPRRPGTATKDLGWDSYFRCS